MPQRTQTMRMDWMRTGLAIAVAGAMAVLLAAATPSALAEQAEQPKPADKGKQKKDVKQKHAKPSGGEKGKVVVGVYQRQKVFSSYPGRQQLVNRMRTLQGKVRKAQQNGNQQKMRQAQKNFRAERTRMLKKYQSDVQKVMPAVARDTGVELIVTSVVYSGKDVKTKDVTKQIIGQLSANASSAGQAQKGQRKPKGKQNADKPKPIMPEKGKKKDKKKEKASRARQNAAKQGDK